MIKAGALAIRCSRTAPLDYVLEFHGTDLTGDTLHGQVRQRADNPGAAEIDLPSGASAGTNGLRLISVTTVGGMPISRVALFITEATLAALPAASEPGQTLTWYWDLQRTPAGGVKATILAGQFIIAPAVTTGGSSTGSGGTGTDAIVTIVDEVVEVLVDGAELVAPSVAAAAASAVAAAASEAGAQSSEDAGAASAVNAGISQGIASTAATTATTQAGIASAASAAAVAIAGQGGIPKIYQTKAAAVAAIGAISTNEWVMVLVDESLLGQRVLYQKSAAGGGTLVNAVPLDVQPRRIYVDSINGNDSNAGTSPQTAKLTLTAAAAIGVANCTFLLARGSVWYNQMADFSAITFATFMAYGQGNPPVIDGGIALAGSWTADGAAWYQDVTFANATTGSNSNLSGCWHPALYDESTTSRVDESGVTRYIGASQAASIAYVKANPGTFYAYRVGSSLADVRGDNGTTFRIYFQPADASNPNSNGRTVRTVNDRPLVTFGSGARVEDITFRRNGGKDMVSTAVTTVGIEQFVRCQFIEAAVHGAVAGGALFRGCYAKAAYHGDSRPQGGGAFHNFRATSTVGRSRGCLFVDNEADGFSIAVYSHNAGNFTDGTAVEHETFDIDGLVARNCNTIIADTSTIRGVRARRIRAERVYAVASIPAGGATVIDDSFILIDPAAGLTQLFSVTSLAAKITLRRTLIYSAAATTGLMDPITLGTIASQANMPELILIDSTVLGTFTDPGNANRVQQNFTLTNSVLGVLTGLSGGVDLWPTGNIKADATSSVECSRTSIEALMAAHAGVASGVLTGVRRQVWEKTILLTDLNFRNTTRTATYSGTPNGDGTATLALNYNDLSYGRYVRVVDAYGAGLHYHGRIVTPGTTTGSPIIVSPAPTGSFTSKLLHVSLLAHSPFKNTITAAAISTNGAQVRVPDGTQFKIGMLGRVGGVAGGSSFGVRAITAISGNILTLDSPCSWLTLRDGYSFNSLDGTTTTNRRPLPTVDISFGFPLIMRQSTWQTAPSYSVAPVEGGAAITSLMAINGTGGFTNTATTVALGYKPDGSTNSYGSVDPERGYVEVGFGVAVGDVLTVTFDAEIKEHQMGFLTPPHKCGAFIPDPTRVPVIRGAGYRGTVTR